MCASRLVSALLLFGFTVVIANKPNIVFILADDMGFNDVGFRGGDVRTPNIDALAAHGIILNRHYAQPSCTPSRTALMTGRYPIRSGMQGTPIPAGVARGLPLEEKIFPQYFKDLGYKTHLLGKWHLGYETWDHMPTRRGFDSFFGYLNGLLGYYDGTHSQGNMNGRDFRRNESPVWEEIYGRYISEVLTEEAVSVIKSHQGYGGLLLFLHHDAVHAGNINFIREAPPTTSNFTDRAIYAEMVRYADESIGEVMTALDEQGSLNNSIIVFLSDNGAPTTDPLWNYANHGSNWPLRGQKMSSHEGGVRTAAVIWSPLLNTPRMSDQLFHMTDWLPTLYSAAGGSDGSLTDLDGENQWSSLAINTSGPRAEILVDIDDCMKTEALIKGEWKIIKHHAPESKTAFADIYCGVSGREAAYDPVDVTNSVVAKLIGKPVVDYRKVRKMATLNTECLDKDTAMAADCYSKHCLYNILEDPTECADVSAQHPELLSELQSRLESYKMGMVPWKNVTTDPRADPSHWDDFWSPWLDSRSLSISMKPSLGLVVAIVAYALCL